VGYELIPLKMKLIIYSFLLIFFQSCFSQKSNFHDLDPRLGSYQTAEGKEYVIGKSSVRYFLYDPNTLDFRGLYKQNDSLWTSYSSILKDSLDKLEKQITFSSYKGIASLNIKENAQDSKAIKTEEYIEENVKFISNGLTLKGTLLLPNITRKVPAVVLVHGSGNQDRNGYASYIRIIADHLAKNGIAVLTYDKRGCGLSEGDWREASFSDLAKDAIQGSKFLASFAQIDQNQIGLGGSSQAGWILAKAVSLEPAVPFAFCISGAGMGISAAKQNIYNNVTELRTLGANGALLAQSENAWNALYQYIKTSDKSHAKQLDDILESVSNPEYLNYFPPRSSSFNLAKKEWWFQTLEVNYDPIPEWKSYQGSIYAVFGSLDASTPVDMVLSQLKPALSEVSNRSNYVQTYSSASHLILEATLKSDSEFSSLKRFKPYFFSDLSNWILKVTGHQSAGISEVISLEKQWLKAYEQKDLESMKEIVDDKFIITFPIGTQQTKEMILNYLPNQNKYCPEMRIYTTGTTATEYEGAVILRGVVTTECKIENEKRYQRQKYTDTYIKINGKWVVVASHLSDY
jgi:pimeloyl-ACP methyl ester carboxylesterase|tara:strand:+ start:46604 stop:48322 length:1719 start_codon:yes stop_codon:yes gene_type:complete